MPGVGLQGGVIWQPPRVRTVPNPHRTAKDAADFWLMGSLWGNAIQLGTADRYHVYGIWTRDWSKVDVEFTRDWITVAKRADR